MAGLITTRRSFLAAAGLGALALASRSPQAGRAAPVPGADVGTLIPGVPWFDQSPLVAVHTANVRSPSPDPAPRRDGRSLNCNGHSE